MAFGIYDIRSKISEEEPRRWLRAFQQLRSPLALAVRVQALSDIAGDHAVDCSRTYDWQLSAADPDR